MLGSRSQTELCYWGLQFEPILMYQEWTLQLALTLKSFSMPLSICSAVSNVTEKRFRSGVSPEPPSSSTSVTANLSFRSSDSTFTLAVGWKGSGRHWLRTNKNKKRQNNGGLREAPKHYHKLTSSTISELTRCSPTDSLLTSNWQSRTDSLTAGNHTHTYRELDSVQSHTHSTTTIDWRSHTDLSSTDAWQSHSDSLAFNAWQSHTDTPTTKDWRSHTDSTQTHDWQTYTD